METFYYEKALTGNGLTSTEKQQLNAGAKTIRNLLAELDQTSKTLETYVRLKTFQQDNLKQSDAYIADLQSILNKFSTEKTVFHNQIQQVYNKYQPYQPTDPYLKTAKQMEQILIIQQQLLDSLPYYLNEDKPSGWPVAKIQESILTDEKLLSDFEKSNLKLAYPASKAVNSFKSALSEIQKLKRQAIDDNNFAARQSARHGNKVYISMLNAYNHDLLASHKAFVNYSPSNRQLLDYPEYSPVFASESATGDTQEISPTKPFHDISVSTFNTKKATLPINPETLLTLNHYVEFINESLRQMHLMQILLRNYQSSAEYYRDPQEARKRAALTYSHEDFKKPVSLYQILKNSGSSIDPSYRTSVFVQADMLLNMLQEMDGLSVELISYTAEKVYLHDRLTRSDAILKRYLELFEGFDKKKEQLYNDLRRIFESYPSANPASSWIISGGVLLKTLDHDKEMLFGVKDYLKGEKAQIPASAKLEADARQLIVDEYQNMNGLKRFGRSNGLCPYSPYEDLATNSSRFAEKAQKVKTVSPNSTTNPYESFYYFYNNELVYQYNKFVDLANGGLLKVVNQPDIFAFRKLTKPRSADLITDTNRPAEKKTTYEAQPDILSSPKTNTSTIETATQQTTENGNTIQAKHDTVYVERVRIDTIYMDRTGGHPENTRSLAGFAPNNMVLLLDVSASMDSPLKLPLLKRSIKSLLTLLRPEDQISIVLYSGKARVVLKPTSGSKSAEIARMIDLLQSTGDTDGNEGIRLAYKVINKQYVRGGNNRVVLATDGEFPISGAVQKMIGENARQDVYLSVFTFGRNAHTGQKLKKLSDLGQGSYAHVTEESADLQLILEAQSKKLP
ncbi:hypothetical protein Dfri01_49830 [Dyadobacter frigoris]|nr:hypothetical protein Dfri01_49830 [Dyadobacter frigoris]